jgi:hypothetical protein
VGAAWWQRGVEHISRAGDAAARLLAHRHRASCAHRARTSARRLGVCGPSSPWWWGVQTAVWGWARAGPADCLEIECRYYALSALSRGCKRPPPSTGLPRTETPRAAGSVPRARPAARLSQTAVSMLAKHRRRAGGRIGRAHGLHAARGTGRGLARRGSGWSRSPGTGWASPGSPVRPAGPREPSSGPPTALACLQGASTCRHAEVELSLLLGFIITR